MLSGKRSAASTLGEVSTIMDYEILLSRPGITEKDTNFIWASSFRAPLSVSFLEDQMFFNLFLPEGSDGDQEKKIFLNRVGAKFLDGFWQVRRSMDEVTGAYGMAIKIALGRFHSSVLDQVYIYRGRFYAHFVFSMDELPEVSEAVLRLTSEIEDLRVEYLRGLDENTLLYRNIMENEEASIVTFIASPSGVNTKVNGKELPFIMGNVPDTGVRIVARCNENAVPAVLRPGNVVGFNSGLLSFSSGNDFLQGLVKLMATNHIVFNGFYGSASGEALRLSVVVPSKQTTALVKLVSMLTENGSKLKVQLQEVTDFKSLIK